MDRFGPSGMGRMNGKCGVVLCIFIFLNLVCCSVLSLKLFLFLIADMDRGIGGGFDREFGGRNDMGMSRSNFGDSFDRGMG